MEDRRRTKATEKVKATNGEWRKGVGRQIPILSLAALTGLYIMKHQLNRITVPHPAHPKHIETPLFEENVVVACPASV